MDSNVINANVSSYGGFSFNPFYQCSSLTSISIPSWIKYIDADAFRSYTLLNTVSGNNSGWTSYNFNNQVIASGITLTPSILKQGNENGGLNYWRKPNN